MINNEIIDAPPEVVTNNEPAKLSKTKYLSANEKIEPHIVANPAPRSMFNTQNKVHEFVAKSNAMQEPRMTL